MKVEAYRCDKCGKITREQDTIGIYPIEDLFDKLRSYPVCTNPKKTNCHHCMECYHTNVIVFCDKINREKDMRAYNLKVSELYLNLKQTCIFNVMNRKRFTSIE